VRFSSSEAVKQKIPYRLRAIQVKPIGGMRSRSQAFFFVSFLLLRQKK
jgi:hypothetical protein